MYLFKNNTDFDSYTDNNTSYFLDESPEQVITKLDGSSRAIFKCFNNNGMKANPGKCLILVSKNGSLTVKKNSNTKTEKLLGITFDHRLTFNNNNF